MTHGTSIKHEFVELIPKDRAPGVLYVSIPYATAVHDCFCGCGLKVVTPISPVGWSLTFDGRTVSLHPSIGNWEFPCRSHYFIRRNEVVWAGAMSQEEIDSGRARDQAARSRYFNHQSPVSTKTDRPPKAAATRSSRGFWSRLKFWEKV